MNPIPEEIQAEVDRQGWVRCNASTDDHPWFNLYQHGAMVASLPHVILRSQIIKELQKAHP